MTEEKTTRELVYETNRDVKWICRALQRMEAQDEDFETRIRALEGWRAEKAGEERRVSTISAGAGGVVGGVVAVIVKVLGGGVSLQQLEDFGAMSRERVRPSFLGMDFDGEPILKQPFLGGNLLALLHEVLNVDLDGFLCPRFRFIDGLPVSDAAGQGRHDDGIPVFGFISEEEMRQFSCLIALHLAGRADATPLS